MKRFALTIALALGLAAAQSAAPITIGSKVDTEGAVLSQMIKLLLEQDGIEVVDRSGFGTTSVVRQALLAGEIDLYPEYTGTALTFFEGEELPEGIATRADELYETVKALDAEKNDIIWLARSPANNTWALAVPQALADTHSLTTLADLADYVNAGNEIKLAASQEFVDRDDALPAFERTYGFELTGEQLVILAGGNTTQTETAAANGTDGVNAAMAYGTDGALAALGLVALEDPEGAVAIYQPAPIVRAQALDAHPNLSELLDPLFEGLSAAVLQELNGRVAVNGENPTEVARDYLTSAGLLH